MNDQIMTADLRAEQSVFKGLRGTEDTETVKDYIKNKSATTDNFPWLIGQLRQDPRIFSFTKAGYSFKPESYKKHIESMKK